MALGALIIKARLNLTDEEVAEQIKENPYPQLFIALTQGSTILIRQQAPRTPSQAKLVRMYQS